MAKRVRRCAVQGQFRANPDTDNHEAELIVQRIGQNTPEIVLNHGIKDRERGHSSADVNQYFRSGIAARQRINCELCRERA